jgi:hypothetical protein
MNARLYRQNFSDILRYGFCTSDNRISIQQAIGDFPTTMSSVAGGLFSTLQLPTLTGALGWNTSQLYSTGVLSVIPTVHGDFNRDGQVTAADIPAMLTALTDLNSYTSTNSLSPTQLASIGDFDNSGTVTNRDIQGLLDLVASLGGGSVAAVPEPASLVLLSVGVLMAACRCKQRQRRSLPSVALHAPALTFYLHVASDSIALGCS